MGKTTGISWTDGTWNPIRGCTRVSRGCEHCYAESVAYRFSGPGQAYEGLVRIGADGERKPQWNGAIQFVEKHLLDPLRWKTPLRIFVNSMSDLFHENVTDEMRDRIFAVMALSPQHRFQVLTKRPERMLAYLGREASRARIRCEVRKLLAKNGVACHDAITMEWPFPHVWLGVSVEDRKAKSRIDVLRKTPAAVRFLSLEPLLEDLGEVGLTGIDWVIVGGESGPWARPMHPDWARGLRDQCVAAGVPFFFKQWGAYGISAARPIFGKHTGGDLFVKADGTLVSQGDWWCGHAVAMDRYGTKAAGDLLDGRQWHEFPEGVR